MLKTVAQIRPTTLNVSSGGGVAPTQVVTQVVTGVDCLNGKVSVTAWGGGENIPNDQYLVGYSVTNRTTTGCTVNIQNQGASVQTLSACIIVLP
jgi:hypothetical protein